FDPGATEREYSIETARLLVLALALEHEASLGCSKRGAPVTSVLDARGHFILGRRNPSPTPAAVRSPNPTPVARARSPAPEPDAGRPSPTAAAAEQAGGRNGRFARDSTDDSSANMRGHVEELAADVARRVRLALSGLRASSARSSSFTGSSSSRSPASP